MVNIFENYKQKENQFTNGLFSLISLSQFENKSFIIDILKPIAGELTYFTNDFDVKVLKQTGGTFDAIIECPDCVFAFETNKLASFESFES